MRTINLKQLDLIELEDQEKVKIEGGVWWLAAGLIISGIAYFGDIREGIVDGFNGTPRH